MHQINYWYLLLISLINFNLLKATSIGALLRPQSGSSKISSTPTIFTPFSINSCVVSKESTSFLFKASPIKQEHIPSTPNQSKHQDNNNNIVITTQTEDSFDQFKGNYLKLFKKQSKKAAAIQRAKEQQAKKHLIKAPDFKKLISRDHLNMMDDKKKSVIPFSLPNFKQVRERPLSMVVYDRIHYKNTKAKEFKYT